MSFSALVRAETGRLLRSRLTRLLCGLTLLAPLMGSLFRPAIGDSMASLYLANPMAAAAVALLPPLFFWLGVGALAGQAHPALLIAGMAAAVGLCYLPLPEVFDLYGGVFFAQYPLTLGVLDPAFSVPLAVIAGRMVYLLAGGFCFWRSSKEKSTQIHF